MEHAVDVTKIVVRTRVMSSLSAVKVPRRFFPPCCPSDPRCFSSSSANSRTFQGYNVVMAISAAWSKASAVNIPSHMVSLDANSFVVKGTMGASGLRATMPPPACAGGSMSQEMKGRFETKNSVRKAERMPRTRDIGVNCRVTAVAVFVEC